MLTGMSGFGRQEKNTSWGRFSLEVRSVNHRFLEIVFHLPEGFGSLEEDLKKILSSKIRRGRVLCNLAFEPNKSPIFISINLAKSYIKEIVRLKKALGLQEEIKLETILHLPGIFSSSEDKNSRQTILPQIKMALNQALARLIQMRQKEGEAIARDFYKRLDIIAQELGFIRTRIKKIINQKRKLYTNADEFSAFLKDTDITEELIRMDFHLKNFKNQITKSQADGKELDFIAQELQREINTISAKSVDALISTSAIKIKSEVEKLREQLQNVE